MEDINEKINLLKNQIHNDLNIGLSLIDLLDDQDTINSIHRKSENILKNAAISYTATVPSDADIVFISLCIIGLQHYKKGDFYDAVENQYTDLYNKFSKQKIEGIIRSILSRFQYESDRKSSRVRVINAALINTLVPQHYLPAFFDFVFDIYCLNFDREIPEDVNGGFEFAFKGLRESINPDSDEIELSATKKTYKLIKTTKDILTSDKWIEQLIHLSVNVVNIIDAWYWQDKIDLINSYYEFGFSHWNKPSEQGDKKSKNKSIAHTRSSWKPEYRLIDGRIYLEFPIHKVKEQFDYREIYAQIINDDQIITLPEPKIKEIVGGYQIEVERICLDKPLGKTEYQLMCGANQLYSSKNELNRDFIVFNHQGRELLNNTDYEGDAYLCLSPEENVGDTILKNENYKLTQKSINKGDSLNLHGNLFCFSRYVQPGIYGEQFEDTCICIEGSSKVMQVFKTVNYLVFEYNENNNFEILINKDRYKLSSFNISSNIHENHYQYIVAFNNNVKPGINAVSVFGLIHGKKEKIFDLTFAYDPGFILEGKWCDALHYHIDSLSEIFGEYSKDVDIAHYEIPFTEFEFSSTKYKYYFKLDLNMYKLSSASGWNSCNNEMWIYDIKTDETIDIANSRVEYLVVEGESGQHLREIIDCEDLGYSKRFKIDFITSFKQDNKYIDIMFYDHEKKLFKIRCYMMCVIDEQKTRISTCLENGGFIIDPVFYGKNQIDLRIESDEGISMFEYKNIANHNQIMCSGLKSFKEYNICFYEKQKSKLSSLSKQVKIYSKKFRSYCVDDFVGKFFKITSYCLDDTFNLEDPRQIIPSSDYYLKFDLKRNDGIFEGQIMTTSTIQYHYFWLKNISPLIIEICSDVIDDKIEIAITTQDGDGLLADAKLRRILNTDESKKDPSIYSFIINANGKEQV